MLKIKSTMLSMLCTCLIITLQGCHCFNTTSLGRKLGDLDAVELFLVNETLIQITGLQTSIDSDEPATILFNHVPPDQVYLRYIDERSNREVLAEINSLSGIQNNSIVVMTIPKSILLFENGSTISIDSEFNSSTLTLPTPMLAPIPFLLPSNFESQDEGYSDVSSGNVTVISERSVLIEQLIFRGTLLADPYIIVGRRSEVIWGRNPHKAHKCFVRGYDDNSKPLPWKVDYFAEDVIIDLPSGLTLRDVDFISIFEMRFNKQLSTVYIDQALPNLPAYIPSVLNSPDFKEPWPIEIVDPIYDNEFHVTVGHPGGRLGYIGQYGLIPNGMVFYINDVLAPRLRVEAGKNYIFKIAGGYRYKLYITNQPSGGYNLINQPKLNNHRLLAQQIDDASKLCVYGYPSGEGFLGLPEKMPEPEDFSNFADFKRGVLRMTCEKVDTTEDDRTGRSSRAHSEVMEWTPSAGEKDGLYYGALDYENMGARILITPEKKPEPATLDMLKIQRI